MTQSESAVTFDDVTPEHLENYFKDAIEFLIRRELQYRRTHDAKGKILPQIVISPPDEKLIIASKKRSVKHILAEKDGLRKELESELQTANKARHEQLKMQYDARIADLKSKILDLEDDIVSILDELDKYMSGTHPHFENHLSREDLESEVQMLEHKLQHFEKRSQKYNDLVVRLTDARKRLHAIDVA